MNDTVKSFNDKIDEIKNDREKFKVLMDEFFDSKDMNIKELLAEMMFHIIMTRGAELQEKFEEIDKIRKMFIDIDIDNTYPTYIPPSDSIFVDTQWSYTGTSEWNVISLNNGDESSSGLDSGYIDPILTSNSINITNNKIQNIIDRYEKVSNREYSDESFKSAINAISTINWSAGLTR